MFLKGKHSAVSKKQILSKILVLGQGAIGHLAGRTAYFAKRVPSTPEGGEHFLLFTIVGRVITVARMAILRLSSRGLEIRVEFMREVADW